MRSRRFLVPAVVTALAAAGVVAFIAQRGTDAGAHRALRPDNPDVVALGQRIYRERCVACHGARLEGQPNWRERGPDGLLPAPPHDASGHTWHHPDEMLFRLTKYGVAQIINDKNYVTAMPVYEGVLSDDEIIAALSYIKAQWPRAVREQHDRINAQYLKARGS